MQAWVVRGQGDPWDVYQRADVPEPSHEAMAGYAVHRVLVRIEKREEQEV